ncbi:MAG: bifunctional folylpolyglutamate synthase/dihydrofolate synthase [Cytophagaceae bacterium]
MDYQQTLDYLYNSLPMFQKIGARALKNGLFNTENLCRYLGNPERKIKTIHVAGTNGKGSSCHMLSAILQSAGYKTGLFTSPHLKNFTERFRINGQEMPSEEVVNWVARHKDFLEEIQPSFFEMNVGLAFDYFARQAVDIAIIETGLGGRLDSTNVINPELSLITNISYDHQNILGDTLELIACEKAGIIKENTPVIISFTQEVIKHVFTTVAEQKGSPLYFADQQYHLCEPRSEDGIMYFDVEKDGSTFLSQLACDLSGNYQTKNLPGIFKAVDVLNEKGWKISQNHLINGLKEVCLLTGLKGRWQVLKKKPLVVCDTGHNEDGISNIVQQLNSIPHQQLYIVLGLTADKDVNKVLSLLPKHAYYYFCNAKLPRAMNAEMLALQALGAGLEGEVIEDVNEAYLLAKAKAQAEDIVFIGGSTFVVAELNDI